MAQRLARGAHNSEVTRSKRVAGIHSTSPALQKRAGVRSAQTPSRKEGCGEPLVPRAIHRGGAEEARGAHNLEVIGSSPIPGIHSTSPALQKRAGVRSAQTPSRKEGCGEPLVPRAIHRGGAEEARGAHNLEVIGSSPIPGIHSTSPALQKRAGVRSAQTPSERRGAGNPWFPVCITTSGMELSWLI